MIRRSAVAGSFYAGTRDRLRLQLEDLLPKGARPESAIGAVVPHAGYMYSGRVTASVFARVEFPDTFVILGPNHTGLGAGAAIMTYGQWETPLGQVEIDHDLGKAILANSSVLEEDNLGHLREHSIEVQLPFLQYFGRPFGFVPICLFSHEYAACQEVGLAVAKAVRESGKRVLIVASTDMSHYVSRDEAAVKDRKAIPNFAVHGKAATHGLGQVLANRKPQTCSRNLGTPGLWTAVKRLKYLLQLRAMDADSAVLNTDGNFLPAFRRLHAGRDANAAIGSAVLDRVGDQILQAAAHRKLITEHARQGWFNDLFNSAGRFDDQGRHILVNALQNF